MKKRERGAGVDKPRGCLPTFDEDDTEKTNVISPALSRSSSFAGKPSSSEPLTVVMGEDIEIALPSDQSWRMKNYFKLLDKQKAKTLILHMMPPDDIEEAPKWEQAVVSCPETKKAKMSNASSLGSEGSVVTSTGSDISWNSLDLAKSAKLLGPKVNEVTFNDEDEMRRIFALLYDVFRYKSILNDALWETGFYQKHPELEKSSSLVWLLFYDLHKRRFLPRAHADAIASKEVFEEVGLSNIEKNLWNSRIKLAASLARSRIKNNALRLNQLLPEHLKDERFISVEETPVTGWINTFQKSKKEIIESIERLGLKLQSKHETVLTKNDFRFDHLCPKLLLCHPIQRPELAQSPLIKNHTVVLQDRAFCIGPALLGKILTEIPLRGTVAQTHVNTPRTTAYLANVLVENERLDKLIAFGAGEKLLEYQTYFHDLGVTNCEIYAEKFVEIHPEAAVLENLVAVIATPPNSCTGVTDPVDLICSRGGDMKMLKALTELQVGEDSVGYLEEQTETLKYCMSLPQVQIILYETHSLSPKENFQMVSNVIEMVNTMAQEKHEEARRLLLEKEEAEEKANKAVFIPGKPTSKEQKEREREAQEAKEATPLKPVEVPPCDLFEVVPLPGLCLHGSECFAEEGCFLSRIQRKEIISLDAKYMIKIAEARGLFGTDPVKKKSQTSRIQKKEERRRRSSAKFKIRKIKLEIDRLAAPTQSTIRRNKTDSSVVTVTGSQCPRQQLHKMENKNKGDADDCSNTSGDTKKLSPRSRKSQEESIRRLSRPILRSSASPETFSSEVKPRFWRYATAKSVEDLIRALKRKRRGKRVFKVEDYFFFKDQMDQMSPYLDKKPLASETGIYTATDETNLSPFIETNTIYERTLVEPSIKSKKSYTEAYYTDDKVIKPFINKDVLRIMSYGTVSDRSLTPPSVSSKSLEELRKGNHCSEMIQQCMDNASVIFKKIDEIIEENKRLAVKKIKLIGEKENQFSQVKKFKNKSFSPLEALSKIEEISNIIDLKRSGRTDIILSDKYLPGKQITHQQEQFVKTLQKKLEKIQQNYQRWTKWQETQLIERLSVPKRVNTRR